MNAVFDEPWDPDAPLRERLIARGPAIAMLACHRMLPVSDGVLTVTKLLAQ